MKKKPKVENLVTLFLLKAVPDLTFNLFVSYLCNVQGLKTFSNWPTYPQLYIDGELIGGLDIIKEMVASGIPV
jgi:hypothetical protein